MCPQLRYLPSMRLPVLAFLLLCATAAGAQNSPPKPLRLITAEAGGGNRRSEPVCRQCDPCSRYSCEAGRNRCLARSNDQRGSGFRQCSAMPVLFTICSHFVISLLT